MMDGREENGRFKKGHTGNPNGRAPRGREERYYEILKQSVSIDDWKQIITKAVDQAKRGDAVARKWLADYLIGPPVEPIDITNRGTLKVLVEYVDSSANDQIDPPEVDA